MICHEWALDEEFYCCRKYIFYMLNNLPDSEKTVRNLSDYKGIRGIATCKTIYDVVFQISNQFLHIPLREIEHKFKQIKQVSNDYLGKDDFVCIAPHRYYSKQLKQAYEIAAEAVHREITGELPEETAEEREARIAKEISKYGRIIISQDEEYSGLGDYLEII